MCGCLCVCLLPPPVLMLIVLHSAPSQHPWHKLCFLTGLFLFCRAPPYLSTCILCTQTHSLRPLQVPDTLLDLMHSPPSTRLPSPSLSSPGLFCFRLEPSLQNNVHCQRDVGGERRALPVCVCSTDSASCTIQQTASTQAG